MTIGLIDATARSKISIAIKNANFRRKSIPSLNYLRTLPLNFF